MTRPVLERDIKGSPSLTLLLYRYASHARKMDQAISDTANHCIFFCCTGCSRMIFSMSKTSSMLQLLVSKGATNPFSDSSLYSDIVGEANPENNRIDREIKYRFFYAITLCRTCIDETEHSKDQDPIHIGWDLCQSSQSVQVADRVAVAYKSNLACAYKDAKWIVYVNVDAIHRFLPSSHEMGSVNLGTRHERHKISPDVNKYGHGMNSSESEIDCISADCISRFLDSGHFLEGSLIEERRC